MKRKLPTPFIKTGFLLGTGSTHGYNQWQGAIKGGAARGHYIINKSVKAIPYINKKPKRESHLGRLYQWLDDRTKNARIDVIKPSPKRFIGPRSLQFDDGSVVDCDLVVFATGYKTWFPFLSGEMRHTIPDEHQICYSSDPTMSFVGFVRPNVGAIPPMAEMQVQWWIQRLRGRLNRICKPLCQKRSYHLLSRNERTGDYAVDYGAYMHDLAREVGSAPNVFTLLCRSPRAFVAYALGQSYITFFRMQGPFSSAGAASTCANELLEPVLRRSFAANFIFVAVICFFGIVNLMAMMLDFASTPVVVLARSMHQGFKRASAGYERFLQHEKNSTFMNALSVDSFVE